jgi:hypothetical protein
MDDEVISNLDYGSNISGLGLLLNAEKVSASTDLEDIEKRVKSMYSDDMIADDSDDEEGADPMREYKEAIENLDKDIEEDDDEDEEDEEEDTSASQYGGAPAYQYSDNFYVQKTREEELSSNINAVMQGVPDVGLDMDQDIEDDRKNFLLEQIEYLKDDLDELGVSTDRIPQVSHSSPLKSIDEVHKRLMFKYNKLKYNSIAEESIIAGASILEMIFNGQNEYFGCKPDVTGYSDIVKSKLKRIRFETSTAVSRFVKSNNVGVLPRIMMELLPSLITQSQRRRIQAYDTLNASINNASIRNHLTDLNNI